MNLSSFCASDFGPPLLAGFSDGGLLAAAGFSDGGLLAAAGFSDGALADASVGAGFDASTGGFDSVIPRDCWAADWSTDVLFEAA